MKVWLLMKLNNYIFKTIYIDIVAYTKQIARFYHFNDNLTGDKIFNLEENRIKQRHILIKKYSIIRFGIHILY